MASLILYRAGYADHSHCLSHNRSNSFRYFPGYAAVVNNQHILIVGISGVLGGIEGTGDYDLAVDDEEFMMEIVKILDQRILTLNPGGEEGDYGKRRDGSINNKKEPSLFLIKLHWLTGSMDYLHPFRNIPGLRRGLPRDRDRRGRFRCCPGHRR